MVYRLVCRCWLVIIFLASLSLVALKVGNDALMVQSGAIQQFDAALTKERYPIQLKVDGQNFENAFAPILQIFINIIHVACPVVYFHFAVVMFFHFICLKTGNVMHSFFPLRIPRL